MSLVVHLAVLVGATLAGVLILELIAISLRRAIPQTGATLERSLITRVRGPARVIIGVTAFGIALAHLNLGTRVGHDVSHAVVIAMTLAIAWLLIRLTYVLEDVLLDRYRLDVEDNLRSRRIHTQVQVLRRVTVAAVIVIAFAVVLLSFSPVRAAGAGLLASAGLIGIFAGFAAKPVTTNLIAGIQIAITQPVRVDDVVVIDGHWGRVEEISLTYVIVRIWDQRHLVLPISYLVTTPFENWTRDSAALLGWVHLEVDYSAPVAAIRDRLHEVLRSSPEWDGVTWNLQVTGVAPSTLQLRALMSARDSSSSWNLQCKVREELISFLQAKHPYALPRIRTDFDPHHEAPPHETEANPTQQTPQ